MCRSSECDLYCVSTQILQVPGVHQVGQHEVDQAEVAAERHCRLGAVGGQRPQPLSFATGQDDPEHLGLGHGADPSAAARAWGRIDAGLRTGRLERRRLAGRLPRAYRDPDPRIPAGRLRRGRGPRRVPGPRAAQAHRRRRALLRRRPRPGAAGHRPAPDLAGANAALQHPVGRPVDGGRDRQRRRCCTRTPGTPTWPGTSASCCTASRTWSPRTRSSRTGRGRPSSSAAATGSRPGRRRPPTRRPTPIIAVSATACARTSWTATRRWTRPGCTSSATASTPRSTAPTDGTDVAATGKGVDLDAPIASFVGRITRQKGVGHLIAAGARTSTRRAARAVRRARRTRPRSRPRPAAAIAELQRDAAGVFWFDGDAAPAARSSRCCRPDRVRLPVGLRAARHRQPRGDGLRGRGRGQRRRRHPRGRRRRRDRPAGALRRRTTRRRSRPGSPPRSTAWRRTRSGRARWAAPAGSAR